MKSKSNKSKNKSKIKRNFLYNSKNPKKSYNIFNNDNPSDTIHIKYTTIDDVKNTINKLEKLYKSKKYNHKRISQVGMIMKVRLELMKNKKPEQYNLAKRYFEFLSKRTSLDDTERYKTVFII